MSVFHYASTHSVWCQQQAAQRATLQYSTQKMGLLWSQYVFVAHHLTALDITQVTWFSIHTITLVFFQTASLFYMTSINVHFLSACFAYETVTCSVQCDCQICYLFKPKGNISNTFFNPKHFSITRITIKTQSIPRSKHNYNTRLKTIYINQLLILLNIKMQCYVKELKCTIVFLHI